MKKLILLAWIMGLILIAVSPLKADDTELFIVQVPPDILILLDMSGSMNWDPSGPDVPPPPNGRRIDIAKRVLFDLLDDTNDDKINEQDEKSLNVRLGYMRFRNAYTNDDGDPKTGNIAVLAEIGSPYSKIWEKISNPAETAAAGTPLAAALAEAKVYFLRDVNPVDPAIACRGKFLIVITDGSDTWACKGTGMDDESQNPGMYKRRMLTVQRSKELREAGIHVFVVGFGGSMPEHLKRTLNWMAKFGGTENPLDDNAGDPEAYDPATYGDACSASTVADPANHPLKGYAFLTETASELSQALKTIIGRIQEQSYSFTSPTVPSLRLIDRDTLYISSFTPSDTPFWRGTLRAYLLNEDGTVPVDSKGNPVNPIWTSSEGHPNNRRILTTLGTSRTMVPFNFAAITNADLGVSSDWERERLINHIRGIDAYDVNRNRNVTEEREWKLGDIFHSKAVVVGSPSPFFEDEGFSGPAGFYERKKSRTKVILVGSNDGMLHAYNASNGVEEWAYIPRSLLQNLKRMASAHTYYVDGSPKVADVWFYQSPKDRNKSPEEWRTVLVCGLRKGGKSYFALDITETREPEFLWEFPKPTDLETLAKVGESWSEAAIGRVKIEVEGELVERWVAFIGGGFDPSEGLGESNAGGAFFVLDIKTGEILWEFSHARDGGEREWMRHSLAASPKAVDINLDGFIDRVYIGDLGGQLWVFDVSFDPLLGRSNSRWTGKRLFKAPKEAAEKHPIFTQPSVAFDPSGIPWVFFGTGDRENPLDRNSRERFYAVKDDDQGPFPYQERDLSDVTSRDTYEQDRSRKGWYIRLERSEKVLAKPTVFRGLLYFTTYLHTDPDPCKVVGQGRLYIVEYLSGGGATGFSELAYKEGRTSPRFIELGTGAPSEPIISINNRNVGTVIVSETGGELVSMGVYSPRIPTEVLYWREVVR